MLIFFGSMFSIIKFTKNYWKLLCGKISACMKARTFVISGDGHFLLRVDVFMVVPLIIINLLSVMNLLARSNSSIPRCCHLVFCFPLISGNLSGEGTVFPLFLLPATAQVAGKKFPDFMHHKDHKVYDCFPSPLPSPKGTIGRNCCRTMDRVK